uniref:Phospholipid/glycerol acyltransferase domain-containing protein n=1 Tax=Pseudictyota dubia TaxID=2749911 RepID=A0A7R9ZJ14_9STRA
MLCANHVSWMDIPFVAVAIGWRNYKIIAKQELLKVPILSKSLRTSKHVILDRTNRRSQMETFKRGVGYLKAGVNLVTFPEGTRSRDGKMGSFKMGAFKMAQREGAPIVPLSIRYAHKVQPIEYVWPVRRSRSIPASIHIGKPIYSEGKSDDEVMKEVWDAIALGLPESQKPAPGTPVAVK